MNYEKSLSVWLKDTVCFVHEALSAAAHEETCIYFFLLWKHLSQLCKKVQEPQTRKWAMKQCRWVTRCNECFSAIMNLNWSGFFCYLQHTLADAAALCITNDPLFKFSMVIEWPFSAINLTFSEKNHKFYKSLHSHADAAAACNHKNGFKVYPLAIKQYPHIDRYFYQQFPCPSLKKTKFHALQQHMKNGWLA